MRSGDTMRAALRLALRALLPPMLILLTALAAYVGYVSWVWRQATTW